MAQTLFSLLDLFASRFRSNSNNENEENNNNNNNNNNGNSLVTLTVSDAEPQPRSRSHTETTRPTNLLTPNNNNNNNNKLPNRSPNRSPILPRQQRSMTTVQDPNRLRPKSLNVPKNPDGTPNFNSNPNNNNNQNNIIEPNNNTIEPNNNHINNININIQDSITSNDPHQTTIQTSVNQTNSISMHDSVKPLIAITSSQDDGMTTSQDGCVELQEYIDQENDNDVNFASETPIDDPDFPDDKKEQPVEYETKEFIKGLLWYFGLLLLLTLLVSSFSTGYGLFEIYAGCRFTVYKFALWPHWGIALHALSRVFLNFFLCMFPYLLLFWFFGHDITRLPLIVSLVCSSGASVWAIYNSVVPKLNATLALLPSYGFFVIALVFSSHYVGHRIKSPTFRHLFMGQFVSAAITLVLYDFVIVPFYVEATSIQKSVVRILIHPGISALNLFISRSCSSRINPHHPGTQAFPVLIFMWFSTYYGRFFNSNMSLTMMTITMSIVSLLELIWRTTLKPRDKQIVNSICGYCFKKQLTHSANFNQIYRDFLRLEQLYENVSIVTANCVYLAYYSVFDPDGLSYYRILSGMAIQFALEWVTDAVSMYIEMKYYKMDVLSFQKPPRGFYVMIIYTFLLGMAYSTSRIILITHGEWLTDVSDGGSASSILY